MTNKKYCENVLQMLFAGSDSEGEYLCLEMTIGHLMIGTSLLRNGAAGHGESVHKAQTSDHFGPLPSGDGGGGGGQGWTLLSERHWLRGADDRPDSIVCSDRARSKGHQYRCSQCCAMQYEIPYSQEL